MSGGTILLVLGAAIVFGWWVDALWTVFTTRCCRRCGEAHP